MSTPKTNPTSKRTAVTTSHTRVIFDDDGGVVALHRHPLFWAACLLVGGFCLSCAGVLIALSVADGEGGEDAAVAAGEAIPAPRGVTLSYGNDDESTDLLRQALIAQGERRRHILNELMEKFPGAPESMVLSADYARLTAVYEQAQEQRRLKLEADAAAAWEAALKQEKDATRFAAALKDVVARFPGTKPAQDADERLKTLPQPQPVKAPDAKPAPQPPAVKQPVAKPAAPVAAAGSAQPAKPASPAAPSAAKPAQPAPPAKPARKWEYTFTNDVITRGPLGKFSTAFRDALLDWDLTTARARAESLAGSQKYPQLSGFGRACLADAEALIAFERRVIQALEGQKNKTVTLKLAKGSELTGVLSKVDNRELTVLLNGRFPQKVPFPQGLHPEYLLKLYEENRQPQEPIPALVKALYYFAQVDDESGVQALFRNVAEQDNRANVHGVLLKMIFGDSK